MQAIDYSELLDPAKLQAVVPQGAAQADGLYGQGEGVQFSLRYQEGRIFQEVVRLSEGALLLASENTIGDAQSYHQVVTDSDWLHIQFRISGGGREIFPQSGVVETPNHSCIVARYAASGARA